MPTEQSKKAMEIRRRNKRRRVSVDLPPEELDRAKAAAANLGVPFAALLRAALDHLLDTDPTADDLESYLKPRGRPPALGTPPASRPKRSKSASQRARELLERSCGGD